VICLFVAIKQTITCEFDDQFLCGYTSTDLGGYFRWTRLNVPSTNTKTTPSGDATGTSAGWCFWSINHTIALLELEMGPISNSFSDISNSVRDRYLEAIPN
jgi:hypothetical protein